MKLSKYQLIVHLGVRWCFLFFRFFLKYRLVVSAGVVSSDNDKSLQNLTKFHLW